VVVRWRCGNWFVGIGVGSFLLIVEGGWLGDWRGEFSGWGCGFCLGA